MTTPKQPDNFDAERLLKEARNEVRDEIGADLKETLKVLYRKESKAKQVLNGIRHEIEMAEHELKEKVGDGI